MQLKASTDYGMRAVLYLASQGGICSSKDIARDMSIPRDYLIQLAQLLRNAGIIEAKPGKNGGYFLSKDPSEISMRAVMSALDDDVEQTRSRRNALAENSMVEEMRGTCQLVNDSLNAYLDSISIEMLLEAMGDKERRVQIISECLSDESKRLCAGVFPR